MIPIRAYLELLSRYLRNQQVRVAALAVVLIGSIGLQVANPQIVKVFIDRAVEGAEATSLTPLAVAFIVIAIVQQGLAVLATWVAENVGWSATNELRRDLADHCLRLDMGFHKAHSPGEMIERIDGDVTALSNFFSQFSIHVIGNALLLVGILLLLWRENAWIGLALTLFAAVALVVMVGIQTVATEWWVSVRAVRAQFFGFLGEQLGGTEDVRANGADGFMLHRFTGYLRRWLPFELRGRWAWSMLWGTNILLFSGVTILVFWLGDRFLGDGTITLGSVYLVFHYAGMLHTPLERIRGQMEDFQKAGAGIERVRRLFGIETALTDSGGVKLPAGPLRVEFDSVEFSYDDGADATAERVLHSVSFEVAPGHVVGVLGRTGSGKTTIARLLARLYDADSGTVRIDGVPAADVLVANLRRRVAMVTQDVQLFRASVRDNLTFFDESVPDEAIWHALDQLGLADWVRSMPDGLDTKLQSGSGGLSAGEAQLLAFTRVFLEDPGVVILDEASSRLDPATEELLEAAITGLLRNRTGFIIAHRLATVERADDVLILEAGRVVEFGDRARLAADETSQLSQLLLAGMEEVLR